MHSAPMEVLVTVAVLNLNLLPAMNYRENVVKLALGDVGQSAHALDVEKVAVLTQGIRIAKSALQAEQVKIFDLERKLAHAEDDVRHLKEEIQSHGGAPPDLCRPRELLREPYRRDVARISGEQAPSLWQPNLIA